MNKRKFIFLVCLYGCIAIHAHATSGIAVGSGNWNSTSSWSFAGMNRVPGCGDTITIPASTTITVTAQENYFGCGSKMIVYVNGTLQFTNGNKIDFPCGSAVYIATGGVVKKSTNGGGSSTLISICGTVLWTAGDGPVNGPDTLLISSGTTLPVTWLSFEAQVSSKKVLLNWATATEINNDYFNVMRSIDGVHFESIGTIRGAGNSTEVSNYAFTDDQPFPAVSYYRLEQVDYDGTMHLSSVVSVNSKASVNIFQDVNITCCTGNAAAAVSFVAPQTGTAQWAISAMGGGMVANGDVNYNTGQNKIAFPVFDNLPNGMYLLRFMHTNGTDIPVKFMKR